MSIGMLGEGVIALIGLHMQYIDGVSRMGCAKEGMRIRRIIIAINCQPIQ